MNTPAIVAKTRSPRATAKEISSGSWRKPLVLKKLETTTKTSFINPAGMVMVVLDVTSAIARDGESKKRII